MLKKKGKFLLSYIHIKLMQTKYLFLFVYHVIKNFPLARLFHSARLLGAPRVIGKLVAKSSDPSFIYSWYKPNFGTWTLLFGSFRQLRVKKMSIFLSKFYGCFFHIFVGKSFWNYSKIQTVLPTLKSCIIPPV